MFGMMHSAEMRPPDLPKCSGRMGHDYFSVWRNHAMGRSWSATGKRPYLLRESKSEGVISKAVDERCRQKEFYMARKFPEAWHEAIEAAKEMSSATESILGRMPKQRRIFKEANMDAEN